MPDFQRIVQDRVGCLRLREEREREIQAELAAHLEDRYQEFRDQGSGESGAMSAALTELGNIRGLRENIRRAEEGWMDRKKQFLIPALASMCVSAAAQTTSYGLHGRPFVFLGTHTAYVLQPAWLVALPLAGALGAFLARRAGAPVTRRLLAASAPAWMWLPVFILAFFVDVVFGSTRQMSLLAGPLVSWLVVPAVASLLGALPFLRDGNLPARNMVHAQG